MAILYLVPLRLWFFAKSSGAKVEIFSLVGMRLRRVPPAKIVHPFIKLAKADIHIPIEQLEVLHLAGGRVDAVADAMIAARGENLELPFERAVAIHLAGEDILETARMNHKVTEK